MIMNLTPPRPAVRQARLLNLIAPGAGLILVGSTGLGVGIAIAFAILANLALVADFIAPDEFGTTTRAWLNGLALGVYFGSQVRLAGEIRRRHQAMQDRERRRILREANELLLAGDAEAAWETLLPVADQAEHDLVVAVRVAQVLLAKGDPGAPGAWALVRRLDRHQIYRAQVRDAEQRLRLSDRGPTTPTMPTG